MESVLFFDTEVQPKTGKILDYGGVFGESYLHSANSDDFLNFVSKSSYLCAHNVIFHDLPAL